MSDTRLRHPSAEQLMAFALKRLSADETAAVQTHLTACEYCRRLLREREPETLAAPSNVPPATVVQPPRDSKGGNSKVDPGAPTQGPAPSAAPAECVAPAELADHPRYRVLK